MKTILQLLLFSLSLSCFAQNVNDSNSSSWSAVAFQKDDFGPYVQIEEDAKVFRLNHFDLLELSTDRIDQEIPIPLPSGKVLTFRVSPSSVMHPELQAKFSQIRTFLGTDVENPANVVRIVEAPGRFHAMVQTNKSTVFVDRIESTELYAVRKGVQNDSHFTCEVDDHDHRDFHPELSFEERGTSEDIGEELRTYRMALAMCGEVTVAEGGPSNGMLRAVELISDLNLIYEREFSVHFELIANNDVLIFPDPATDPYAALGLNSFLDDQVVAMDSIIGAANFDIAHVINNTSGGLAFVGVACENYWKAGGTSPNNIEVLAHEVGHQMGCIHTFNACNESSSDPGAWEPGSGNTIMSYFGNCGSTNMPGSDLLQYHTYSYSEIHYFITQDDGSTCPVITETDNAAPNVSVPASGKTIPIKTPFELEGSATDDGPTSSLTYRWEQFDQGNVRNLPQFPEGSAPIFRSLVSQDVPLRTFPALQRVVTGTSDIGETLPTYSRELNFRMMVLDNNPGAGGVAYDSVKIHVEETAGPFKVLNPNGAELWSPGQTRTVEWDVSNTDVAPVSCENVDILISYDGGYTYPDLLATSVPNDGQQDVIVPNNPGSNVRVKIRASDNFFFDISDENFEIVPSTTYDFTLDAFANQQGGCSNSNQSFEVALFPLGTFTNNVDLQLSGLPAGVSTTLPSTSNPLAAINFEVENLGGLTPGTYPFQLTATEQGGSLSHSQQLEIEILGQPEPTLGNSLSCDGNQRIYVDHHPKFQFGEDQSFTAECWFKTTSNEDDLVMMGPKDWLLSYLSGWVIVMQNGVLRFNVADGDLEMNVSSTNTYNDGEWHHVAVTMDRTGQADKVKLYVDGHLVDQDLNGHLGSIDVSGAVDFGIGMDGRWHYKFVGELEELRVWNRALSTVEIRENMHVILDDCDASLMVNFQFNEASGNLFDPVSQMDGVVATAGTMISSTCPVGPGTSSTQVETFGPMNYSNSSVLADYSLHGDANTTISKLNIQPYGEVGIPSTQNIVDQEYWVMNRFEETSGYTADLTFSNESGVSASQEANPQGFKLYNRPFNSDGTWTWISHANQASDVNNTISFPSISEPGQFLITQSEIITGVSENADLEQVQVLQDYLGNVTVNFGTMDSAYLNVFSTNGQLVYQTSVVGNKSHSFKLNGAAGIYVLEVSNHSSSERFKLVLVD